MLSTCSVERHPLIPSVYDAVRVSTLEGQLRLFFLNNKETEVLLMPTFFFRPFYGHPNSHAVVSSYNCESKEEDNF